ncbi:hypothetical protein SLOPH_1699 [Spraguea lophii 42_110]|uniref:Uncharacterized protein n=1 Tax=Spraguea lophii (strain 42_110) TaxID=1358809 RepID=S7XT65_SPRLO|nr:hypothetical protein SLOPH_1699 [Spraguea lophii 42_110]
MKKKYNFSKIINLYLTKCKNIQILYSPEYNDPFLHFIFSFLFPSFIIPQNNLYFSTSKSIVQFFIFEFFSIKISINEYTPLIMHSKNILEYFILLEKLYPNLYLLDTNYFLSHVKNLNNFECKSLLNDVTSLTIEIIKEKYTFINEDEFIENKNIYYFLLREKIKDLSFDKQIEIVTEKIEYPSKIYNFITKSRSLNINNQLSCFLYLYPEKYIFDGYISKNRLKYLREPLSIKLIPKYVNTYIKASLIYQNKLQEDNCCVLLKTIFIEKIFKNKEIVKFSQVITNFLLEDKILCKIIFQRKFDEEIIDILVKEIPVLKISFKLILKLYYESNFSDNFYQKVAKCLIKYHPTLKKELYDLHVYEKVIEELLDK